LKIAQLFNKLFSIEKNINKETGERPWGFYSVLGEWPTHKVKRVRVIPGRRLSLQRHKRRKEHWFIVQGKAKVTLNKKEIILNQGEAVDINPLMIHRIENVGSNELVFIEVQSGDYFGEDDIERLEDDYGRR
jgi:mannose-6-phosphate isomerase